MRGAGVYILLDKFSTRTFLSINILPQKTAQTPHIIAFIAILSNYLNKILRMLVPKQDCLVNASDVEFSMTHNIGSSSEIPCIGPHMG
jgi:hypothetical protein